MRRLFNTLERLAIIAVFGLVLGCSEKVPPALRNMLAARPGPTPEEAMASQITSDVSEMDAICQRLAFPDNDRCYAGTMREYYEQMMRAHLSVESAKNTYPTQWYAVLFDRYGPGSKNVMQPCLRRNEHNERGKAVCAIEHHYWTQYWVEEVRSGRWIEPRDDKTSYVIPDVTPEQIAEGARFLQSIPQSNSEEFEGD